MTYDVTEAVLLIPFAHVGTIIPPGQKITQGHGYTMTVREDMHVLEFYFSGDVVTLIPLVHVASMLAKEPAE